MSGPDLIDRFSRSWQLIKASAAVLRSDRELVILPVLSGIATTIVCGALVWQAYDYGTFDKLRESGQMSDLGGLYGWLFVFYLCQYFVVIFFNTALVGAAIERLEGGDPTVASALALAVRRIGPIFGYAIVSATVGVLLRALAERLGFIGRLIEGGVGLAWTVATFLVVPILAAEGLGPVEAITKSASLLRRSWGENLIGNAGISLVLSLATGIIAFVGIGGGTALVKRGEPTLGVPLIVVAGILLLVLIVLGSALSAVYAAAVYRFAVGGETPGGFDRLLIRDAFRPKS